MLTHFPSPYQVELFDALADEQARKLVVYYLHGSHPEREWRGRELRHTAYFLRGRRDLIQKAEADLRRARLAILNVYSETPAGRLLGSRASTGRPWVFWGERPGARGDSAVARLVRRWRLRELHRSAAPIWGIGQFAVDGYQKEFGPNREYRNLPYFSDLERFSGVGRVAQEPPEERVFLFSGSMIGRKGVDLLARAFLRLAPDHPNVRLKLLGVGELLQELRRTLAPIARQVEFLGFKDWDELPAVYASAQVLCAPSRYDGWGMIVPEGLAAGMPVIGTDRTGAALEFLRGGLNGWLIAAGDEAALEQAMREAAAMPAKRLLEMSEAARATVKDHSLEQGVRRFLAAADDAVCGWGAK